MLKSSDKDAVRAALPFIRHEISHHRGMSRAIREFDVRRRTLGETAKSRSPFSSIRLSGSFDRSDLSTTLFQAFSVAVDATRTMPESAYDIEGMSGSSFRTFLNLVLGLVQPAKYLEIGSWKGSTAVAALWQNDCTAVCIDNWSEFGGPKSEFLQSLESFSVAGRVRTIEADFKTVDYSEIGEIDAYFYDGPHEQDDHYDGILLPQPALRDDYLLFVDDWNWRQVRLGTLRAIADSNSIIQFGIEVFTTEDGTQPSYCRRRNEWHNGCFLAVMQKG